MNYHIFSLAFLLAGSGLFADNSSDKMYEAIYNADLEGVTELLRSGYDVNAVCGPDERELPPMVYLYESLGMACVVYIQSILNAEEFFKNQTFTEIIHKNIHKFLNPSRIKIEQEMTNLSKIGIELLNHGFKIENNNPEKLEKKFEEITSMLCPEKSCYICPQPKQPSFCPDLCEFLTLYQQRLVEQNGN